MAVLDTCALLWWTLAPEQLSSAAVKEIDKSEIIYMSSISIWEIGIKIKRGKLELPISLQEYVDRIKETGRIHIIPVDASIWLKNLALNWDHRDPADRTIVATAEMRDLPLVTADKTISNYYAKTIW